MKKRMNLKLMMMSILLMLGSAVSAQTGLCKDNYGTDSAATVKNLSLFNQYFQTKEYAKAFPYWKYLFENTPCLKKRITYNAPTIIKAYLKDLKKNNEEEYKARFDGLVDTLFMAYDKRIEIFGKEGYVLGKKANDLAKLRPKQRGEALEIFAKSVEMEGMKTDDRVPIYYMQAAVKHHAREKYTLDSLYQLYFQMMDIVSYNLKNSTKAKDIKDWNLANKTVNQLMKPYLECEKLEAYFRPQIEGDSTAGVDLIKRATSVMEMAGCEKEPFFIEMAEMLYKAEPSSEAAMSIARSYHSKKNFAKAMDYYKLGVEGMEQGTEKSDVYLQMANIKYRQGAYSVAKGYAQSAIDNDDSNGKAYLIIAQYYGNSSKSCTADNIDGRSVFWAAVDKCVQAKAADPEVEEDANKLIGAYSSKYPKLDDAFFKGFTATEGSSFTVPCLGVTTTVRFKKS